MLSTHYGFKHNPLPWKLELAISRALTPKRRDDPSVDVKYLYPMIITIWHYDSVGVGNGDVVWVLELPLLVADGAEFPHERTIWLENLPTNGKCETYVNLDWERFIYLNSVIFLVTHVDEAQSVRCYSPGVIEFPIGRSLAAECSKESTRWVEYLQTQPLGV